LHRGILFDLFHTLTGLETDQGGLAGTAAVLGVDPAAWNELLFMRSRWRLAGEERDPLAIVRGLARQLDPNIGEDRIREAARIRTERFRRALRRIPEENLRTLRRLRERGLRLGLVSNADALEAAGWAGSPLAGLFDTAVFSCRVGFVKPETEIYRLALDELGLEARETLFVGDGGSGELEGAAGVGLVTVFMSGIVAAMWPEVVAGRRAVARHEIKAIPEIIELLEAGEPRAGSSPG
jgi:putative hydrolase of the HAD superfamily